jgi:hypothetical protein
VSKLLFWIRSDADEVWHDLDGVDETLGEDEADDSDGRMANTLTSVLLIFFSFS